MKSKVWLPKAALCQEVFLSPAVLQGNWGNQQGKQVSQFVKVSSRLYVIRGISQHWRNHTKFLFSLFKLLKTKQDSFSKNVESKPYFLLKVKKNQNVKENKNLHSVSHLLLSVCAVKHYKRVVTSYLVLKSGFYFIFTLKFY